MKRIGIVVKKDKKAIEKADEFEKWLLSKNIEVIRKISTEIDYGFLKKNKSSAPSDLDCLFVLGGDGTFLSAARWIGDNQIPVLGIKFGEVGFLAEQYEKNLFTSAESIIKGDFSIQQRMRLLVRVLRDNKEVIRETALNDIVINKGAIARLAEINTYIDNDYLTTYKADGLIISTPTGSTAYSLAAGGPILHPDVPGIIITPICPFTLTNRPLIVPVKAVIKIEISKKATDIMLTVDGQTGVEIDSKDSIIIEKWPHPVNMIQLNNQNYFDILKSKLKWSGSRV